MLQNLRIGERRPIVGCRQTDGSGQRHKFLRLIVRNDDTAAKFPKWGRRNIRRNPRALGRFAASGRWPREFWKSKRHHRRHTESNEQEQSRQISA
jgi:hypothetical protein